MPLNDDALTTLATVKDELGIGEDDDNFARDQRIERYINIASHEAVRYCDRRFTYDAAIAERHVADGGTKLFLRRWPLTALTSITVDGDTIDTADVEQRTARMGDVTHLYNPNGWAWRGAIAGGTALARLPGDEKGAIVVTYAGGWVTPKQASDDGTLTRTLPYDLEHAIIMHTVSLFRSKGKDRRVRSVAYESATYSFSETIPEVAQVLNRYKFEAHA